MDTRDDGADDPDGRRDGTAADADADVDRRGGPDRTPPDPRAERPDDAAGADRAIDATDARDGANEAESDEVGIAEAVGEDRPPLGPLEPGSPTPENVLFVVLGALATVALIATLL
ncbi:DUF7312 domain-containing protein [Halogeometricum luteum]|uniref:DUF7312 domain-containing protein n=1 Tax=Halogeometricum luteum TaxID=2950537 RepID=A0ABU2FZQ5_9EURY|nr:hypothetical protein [Halogeometricum sp. S3BR5-2]MDS0293503.1 hypothetical protein [Halogeometricum sp. S3BR5-2]